MQVEYERPPWETVSTIPTEAILAPPMEVDPDLEDEGEEEPEPEHEHDQEPEQEEEDAGVYIQGVPSIHLPPHMELSAASQVQIDPSQSCGSLTSSAQREEEADHQATPILGGEETRHYHLPHLAHQANSQGRQGSRYDDGRSDVHGGRSDCRSLLFPVVR